MLGLAHGAVGGGLGPVAVGDAAAAMRRVSSAARVSSRRVSRWRPIGGKSRQALAFRQGGFAPFGQRRALLGRRIGALGPGNLFAVDGGEAPLARLGLDTQTIALALGFDQPHMLAGRSRPQFVDRARA